jgi:hypothetical protein
MLRIICLFVLILASVVSASPIIQIDGADYNWDGTRLPSGYCRLIIDNRGSDSLEYVGTAFLPHQYVLQMGVIWAPNPNPWTAYQTQAGTNYDDEGNWWANGFNLHGNADGTFTVQMMATSLTDSSVAEGCVAPRSVVDVIFNFPGDWAFHSPCVVNVGGQVYTDYNPLPNTTFVPEPATMSLLALGGLAMLRRRGQCS